MKCSFCDKEATRVISHVLLEVEYICDCDYHIDTHNHICCASMDEYAFFSLIDDRDKLLDMLCPLLKKYSVSPLSRFPREDTNEAIKRWVL